MLEIVFDSIQLEGPVNGINRDYSQLFKELKEFDSVNVTCMAKFGGESKTGHALSRIPKLRRFFSQIERGNFKKLLAEDSRRVILLPQVKRLGSGKVKRIIRIHDIFPLSNPQWFSFKSILSFYLGFESITNQDVLVFNSRTTYNELKKNCPEKLGQYAIIPCQSNFTDDFSPDPCGGCRGCREVDFIKGQGEFYLAVGTVEPRKNYHYLLQELALLKNHPIVVIIGKYGWKQRSIKNRLLKNPNVIWLPQCCDGSLSKFYKSTSLFISSSLSEGFNIPAMEACLLRKPLLLSDIPVHREFHGSHAQYFGLVAGELSAALERLQMQNRYIQENAKYCDHDKRGQKNERSFLVNKFLESLTEEHA